MPSPLPPSIPTHATNEDSVRIWIDLMKASDKLVRAGLRHEFGEEGLDDAYRAWFARRVDAHGRHVLILAKKLAAAGESSRKTRGN